MLGSNQIHKLMNTPMSRKEFLRYVGIMLLSLIGVGNVINAINNGHRNARPSLDTKTKRNFGGGKYGV